MNTNTERNDEQQHRPSASVTHWRLQLWLQESSLDPSCTFIIRCW